MVLVVQVHTWHRWFPSCSNHSEYLMGLGIRDKKIVYYDYYYYLAWSFIILCYSLEKKVRITFIGWLRGGENSIQRSPQRCNSHIILRCSSLKSGSGCFPNPPVPTFKIARSFIRYPFLCLMRFLLMWLLMRSSSL